MTNDEAWEIALPYMPDLKGSVSWDEAIQKVIFSIANAVASERARCVKICEAEYETRMASEYPAERIHDFVVVARSIQRKIRGDKIGE